MSFVVVVVVVAREMKTRTPMQESPALEDSSDEDEDDDNEEDFSPPANYRSSSAAAATAPEKGGGGGGGGLGDGSKHGSEPRSAEPADANMALLKAEMTGGGVRERGVVVVCVGGSDDGCSWGCWVSAYMVLPCSMRR